ncbi:hypothetical protein K461DRAFT_274862 [Myriangium duriaei CBS 260.36]|uniref:Mitochondrial ribosomal protein subunit L20 n=1 Tax=Myriangium duriaei CBS 260.36 TaxID=1168546 RepID=A0A9P4J5K6_9PEZI|nr:hypothetical protein K461DRAFT_274862 [Myriangium duriaei CBS 260.36]
MRTQRLALLRQPLQRRAESTARRLRVKHGVPPAPSFIPEPEIKQDHIIYNPPSSLPNVYHTPTKFLPASDPRRPASTSPAAVATAGTASTDAAAPIDLSPTALLARAKLGPAPSTLPLVSAPHERRYHLTQADVSELRRLRAEDHKQWTVKRLAQKFECSEAFVRLCAFSVEAKAEQDQKIDAIRNRWGRTKREAREERGRRREQWGEA